MLKKLQVEKNKNQRSFQDFCFFLLTIFKKAVISRYLRNKCRISKKGGLFLREFTFENIQDMKEKMSITKRNAGFFLALSQKYENNRFFINEHHFFIDEEKIKLNILDVEHDPRDEKFFRRSDRMVSCMNVFGWDMYQKNKLLDLQKVNRCKDRFCPNCRSIAISQSIVHFEKPFRTMLDMGYQPYLLTLTVKNVHGDFLVDTIKKMQKSFRKFFQLLHVDDKNSFKKRLFDVKAGVKALELTVQNSDNNFYHPHYHVLVFLDNDNPLDFKKYKNDGYQRKTQKYSMLSDADIFISKLWTFIYKDIRLNNWDKYSDDIIYTDNFDGTIDRNYFLCDIRELEMPNGIFEVFKYCFKDSDINNFEQFQYIFNAINKKRLRQGHGLLYNIKVEFDEDEQNIDESDNIESYLLEKETPQQLITRKLEELTTTYQSFKKISRFKGSKYINNIT